jgi:hypothetical protein
MTLAAASLRAGAEGIEPPLTVLETAVLPFNYAPILKIPLNYTPIGHKKHNSEAKIFDFNIIIL